MREWSPSVELMLRRVPETSVLVGVVSGVLAAGPVCSPLARIPRTAIHRQRIGEYIQVIQQLLFSRRFGLHPNVSFAAPLTLDMLRKGSGANGVTETLILHAQRLLVHHLERYAGAGV